MSATLNDVYDLLLQVQGSINLLLRRQSREAQNMAAAILDKVTAQTGQIASVKTLVAELKAHQNDPAKLASIVQGLDENSVELAVIANPGRGSMRTRSSER